MNQQLARLCATIHGSEMQSGAFGTITENQRRISKKHKTTQNQQQISNTKCALVFLIHISLSINQQLACLCVTIHGSEMQFGVSSTRTTISNKQNTTQNQSQISNTNAHQVVAFMADLAWISSWHACVRPLLAAQCRELRWPLEQNVRSKCQNHNTTQNQKQISSTHAAAEDCSLTRSAHARSRNSHML
jgi:hypothetical protein